MNRYDIEQIAYRSGLLSLDDSASSRAAFLTTFETNLKRKIEDEKDDEIRRQDRFYSWED